VLEMRSQAGADERFAASADMVVFHFGSTGGDFSSVVGRQLAVVVCGARRHPVLSGMVFFVFSQPGRFVFVRWRASGYHACDTFIFCQAWIS